MTKGPCGPSDDAGVQLLVCYNSECCVKHRIYSSIITVAYKKIKIEATI